MQFPKSYFEDEVRDGFYVSAMMKRAWAAQLEVLADVEKVCQKYNLHYQADWGTLIGAIRHGGFIPWDDDMDISMLREDYDKFNQVVLDELPEYHVLNFDHSQDGNYDSQLTHIYNERRVRIDRGFLDKFHGFPFTAGIDIFPMDYIPPDQEEKEQLFRRIKTLYAVAAMPESGKKEDYLRHIEENYNIKLDKRKPLKQQLYQNAEKICREYTGEGAEFVTNIASNIIWGYMESAEYYRETIRIPFEEGRIEVPVAYDGAMKYKVSEYMVPVRDNKGHDYPFYQRQADKLDTELPLFQKYDFSESDLYGEEMKEEKKENVEQAGLKVHAKEMLQLFGAIRESVVSAVLQGNLDFALGLLADCQDGAIALGSRIEEAKGNGRMSVTALEEFCEKLYMIYEAISEGGSLDVDAVDKQFEEILHRLSDSVQKDIIDRRVAVFLPYKAALWNSLESIWKAADADPDCDAYVIPIPYCEKEFDGTLGEIHYEGEQFPDDVPVTSYETFDFALQHPDMIFFHNPYDEYNLATTVPPMFYARELRKYTDNLVYVPWFVLDEIEENDMRGNISMDYFCTMPGVVCADKVIVQSEQMRKAYIRKLTEFAGEDTRPVWEGKILGIGSPIYDKEWEKRNALEMPEEWKRACLKNDGSLKKIILYNTVPEAMLEHGSAMLDKIRGVLKIFEEQRDDAALAWCPNLSKSDYVKRMKPALWEEYQQLVKEYCNKGWGISCDFSKDNERELILKFGNAYYGDPDSIAEQCRRNHMAVMIQDVGENKIWAIR